MSRKKIIAGMLGLVAAIATTASADIHTGNMVSNPFMTDNYDGWSPNSPWRNNGGSKNQVYDFKTDGPTGWASSFAATRDLTTDADITADPNYDASTTELTDLGFGDVWLLIPTWNTNKIGASLDARFYLQANISTVSGNDYRAISDQVTVDSTFTAGGYAQSFSINNWATYGSYDGNPFDGGAGIALDDISSINYQWVMRTITANTDGAGTVFFQADNAILNYEVTTIPEPATLGMIVALSGTLLFIRRRFII